MSTARPPGTSIAWGGDELVLNNHLPSGDHDKIVVARGEGEIQPGREVQQSKARLAVPGGTTAASPVGDSDSTQ